MRYACIDIGSNTTRLLVAEVDAGVAQEVAAERAYTRLGAVVTREGLIPREKIDEVVGVAGGQVERAREHGATRILAVGTAAIRDAANGSELKRAFEEATGLDLRVLDGDEEARLSFLGASRSLRPPAAERLAVIDVGGGSTELAIGAPGQDPDWWRSLPIGSGTLAAECLHSDPPTATEVDEIRAIVDDATAGLAPPVVDAACAVGGTATSVALMAGDEVGRDALAGALEVLGGMGCAEAAEHFGVPVERAHVLPAGIVVLERMSEALGVPLRIARAGVREGTIIAAAEEEDS